MLRELLDRILDLQNPEVKTLGDRLYSTKKLFPVETPAAKALELSTLTSLVDYIKENRDLMEWTKHMVCVTDHDKVHLISSLQDDPFRERETLVKITAETVRLRFNEWMPAEEFNIFMQSSFLPSPDKEAVLRVVGNIREEAVRETGDDGTAQSVTVREGIARVAEVRVPNPVILSPFRTFTEIDQPESSFVFRMRKGPECKLIEADGGAWKHTARLSVKEYLQQNLQGTGIVVLA